MTTQPDTTAGVLTRVAGVILAWLGSVKLGDIQAFLAILSGLAVLIYTVLQIVSLWRRDFSK
jgi:hypothetical protein